jgi:outer membrane protein assembly factor BamA
MITGAGWISLGPGYRMWFGDRLFFDTSAAMSWREYKMARGRIELANLAKSRLALGGEAKWQDFTQNTYFGEGPDSLESNRSEYRMKSVNALGYADVKPLQWLTIGARAGWLRSPSLLEPAGRFRRDNPPTQQVFPDESAFALGDQPDYAHGELSITADTRDHRSHPLSGGMYRGVWTRFSDRSGGNFSFQRFEAEGAQFVSTNDGQVSVALHGWLVASDTAEGHDIPFYLMPSLGGNNTVRAFANYRFHDRHLAVANVELRLALTKHIDSAMFMDAGNVAARMADLNFDKRAIGFGLRVHSNRATFARLDIARGSEGWRLTFNTSDPLHLSRLSRRTAAIPFVP